MQTITSNQSDNGVLTLTMNRPDVHNAFDAVMISELTTALLAAQTDNKVRVVVITGAGASFSAGADLNWMRSLVNASLEENQRDALELAGLMRTLNYLPKPTIARVNGAAFGGGVGLIATCDMSIAVEGSLFGLTEVRLGLAPAVISPYVFRRIGETHARRYFLTGERFDTSQAQTIGLIQQCVTRAQLDEAVDVQINKLLKGGPLALAHCKQLVFRVAGHNHETQKTLDEYTAKVIAGLRVSTEGQEGLAAFLQKRHADWINKSE